MKKYLFYILLFFVLMESAGFCFADDLGDQCAVVTSSSAGCPNMTSADCKVLLQKCADYYDQQSAQLAQDLTKTSAQKDTLQNAISKLKNKIKGLEADISQGKIMVKDLNLQITDTQTSIDKTATQIQDSQNQIATILQSVYEEDQKPSFVVLLDGNLSDFFSNLAYLDSLNSEVSSLLDSTKNLKSYLEGQQVKMSSNVDQLQKTIALQTLQKKENEQNQQQQNQYLKLTEAQYQQQLKDKQSADKKAADIKARIFGLVGVSKAPTFGEAYSIAKYVSSITGVRPAFLLAILTQETGLGKNVGQCYLTNVDTGSGTDLKGNPKSRVMNPTYTNKFVILTTSLGMDTYKTPISCWQPLYSNGVPYGWGGAMGPAQFTASTWNLYTNKVTSVTGATANPWNINDAFLASGLLLKDNGAATSESTAAAKYYCGGNAARSECKAYARSVISIANGYADDIAAIGG